MRASLSIAKKIPQAPTCSQITPQNKKKTSNLKTLKKPKKIGNSMKDHKIDLNLICEQNQCSLLNDSLRASSKPAAALAPVFEKLRNFT